jgi:glycosyltransferase involved in cell wall biosynthesis/SAM-dependent methyltransferase
LSEPYFLPPGYESRLEPEYFVDDELGAVCQPDLYPEMAAVARRLGSRRIIDVGCGTAAKLAELHPEFEIVGIDFGPNIAACRQRYQFGTWIETDLDVGDGLGYEDVAGAVIVCGDVIEHLVYPERLLRMLRGALDHGASAVFLTTPDRDLFYEPGHLGPPSNSAHVREWSMVELERFLASEQLHGCFGLTRSNDALPYLRNIMAVLPAENASIREIVQNWFGERLIWQRLAESQDRFLRDFERWASELRTAADWAEAERANWQRRAEEVEARLASKALGEERGLETPAHSGVDVGEESARTPATTSDGAPARVIVVTEVDDAAADLDLTARSLLAQTFVDWEWAIVTADDLVVRPIDDARVRVVRGRSRVGAITEALTGRGDVALLEAGATLAPTALEKWIWFLEAHPDVVSVRSTNPPNEVIAPQLIRRRAVDEAGGLDVAAEVARGSQGFVPIPDDRSAPSWGHRIPDDVQRANEPLPLVPSVRNPIQPSERRLLLIVPFMTVGGADKFNLDLIDQLAVHGWHVTVATTIEDRHELYPEYERRTTDLFPLAHFLPLPYYPAFLRYLVESRRPDVVLISNSELGYRLLPYLRGMCPGTPFVDFCHSEAEHWNNGGYPWFSVEYGQLLDMTMTASAHLKRWMVERGGDEDRIEVCYANVDVHTFQPSVSAGRELRLKLQLPQDEPIVLFLGRIADDKQPEVLAEAFAILSERGVRFTPLIAGDGPARGWVEASLSRSGLHDRVRMLGSVVGSDVPALMAAADILFIPSRSEGIALALYEAMSSGTPVVGARVGGQAELVTDDCGILIERSTPTEEAERYADAIEALLRDPGRRRAMGIAARSRVESSFRLEHMGQRVHALLEHSIDLHRTKPKPAPSVALARNSATETIELMRMARLMDVAWLSARPRRGLRGVGVSLYLLIHRAARPAYLWGLRRGWTWLPRARDILVRILAGL